MTAAEALELIPGGLDGLTIVVTLIATGVKFLVRWRRKKTSPLARAGVIVDALNGAMIVPFAIMLSAPFSQSLAQETLKSGKASLSLAGLIGLIFIVAELCKAE